jgi:hypothetical protein
MTHQSTHNRARCDQLTFLRIWLWLRFKLKCKTYWRKTKRACHSIKSVGQRAFRSTNTMIRHVLHTVWSWLHTLWVWCQWMCFCWNPPVVVKTECVFRPDSCASDVSDLSNAYVIAPLHTSYPYRFVWRGIQTGHDGSARHDVQFHFDPLLWTSIPFGDYGIVFHCIRHNKVFMMTVWRSDTVPISVSCA